MDLLLCLLSSCICSFLLCTCQRIINGESLLVPFSYCDHCHRRLRWQTKIPVIGYLLSRGRCCYCNEPIDILYPLLELFSCMLTVMLHHLFLPATAFKYMLLCVILMAVIYCDIRKMIIPDLLIVMIIITRCLFLFAEDCTLYRLMMMAAEAAAIPLLLTLFSLLMRRLTGHWVMGFGDIKLFFACGLYFYLEHNLIILALSCLYGVLTGLIHKKKIDEPFPFGPSIILAVITDIIFGRRLLHLVFIYRLF